MSKWKQIIAGVAPTIATALGGPLAGAATKFLANALLGDENARESQIEAAILSATPDDLLNLRSIENDFKIKMEQIGVDIYKISVDDRKGARGMAVKTSMAPQCVLSVIFIGGYFGLVYMLFGGYIDINESIRDMANILIGVMTANIPQIMAFWFGSSHSSKVKTDKLK